MSSAVSSSYSPKAFEALQDRVTSVEKDYRYMRNAFVISTLFWVAVAVIAFLLKVYAPHTPSLPFLLK